MKFTKGAKRSGPSSSIGILNFFDAEMSGPKLSPEFVLIITGAFILVIAIMHLI